MPDQDEARFSLMSTFIPGGAGAREVLTGYLAVDAEAGSEAGKPSEDYGKLRLLELPRDSTVPGPGQVNNNFNADPTVSNELNILARGDSQVVRGNLLTLPVGGGLLYVQPVYVQAASGTAFPLLQRVLVAWGDSIGFASTLDGALDQVFGGDSGAEAGDAGTNPDDGTTPPTEEPTGEPTDTPTESPTDGVPPDAAAARASLDLALQQARQALEDSQAALQTSNFAAYGEAQERLSRAVEDAIKAEADLEAAGG
jgi:uncharacterized membrane protein (UPF0182 family)